MTTELKEILILLAGMCGFFGLILGLICVAMVAGFTRSTHTVQYVPHENNAAFDPLPDLEAENEEALLAKVGKKKKPTVVEDLDEVIEQINETDLKF